MASTWTPSVVDEHRSITVKAIDAERNIERRRVLIERFGEERLVREGGAELVDEDDDGSALAPGAALVVAARRGRRDGRGAQLDAGAGRHPQDLLPPRAADTRSAREAVAWTFGLRGDEYQPAVES